ncbi:ABC transporter permease [Salsuginibacillus kocurii]|uniref:ABC transporter permease n=1 Tax=Salsuginibacillus kocurii TaxID=427078 RepID=UPI00037A5C1C|nr:ABC transporter permease [Salsuginibacillus kocurii]
MANPAVNPVNKGYVSSRLSWLWSEYSVVIAFVVLLLFATIMHDGFLTYANMSNIFRQVAVIGIISLGMTVVMISGGIDLSVGSVLAFIGAITMIVLNDTGSVLAAIAAALFFGLFIGFLNGVMISKGKIAAFIVTLGVMAAARSLGLYIADGGSISGDVDAFRLISNSTLFNVPYPIIIFLLLTVLLHLLMNKTKFGRHVYAIGSNEKGALLSGIPVDRVKIMAYMLCTFLVGVASIIESSRLGSVSTSNTGHLYELDAIAAVIIGGTRMNGGKGKIIGTFFGILILGVLNNIMNLMGISPYLQGVVKGVIIIVAVLLQKRT